MKGILKFFSIENVIIIVLVLVLIILFIRRTSSGYYINQAPFTITATFMAPTGYTPIIKNARVVIYSCFGADGCGVMPLRLAESDIADGDPAKGQAGGIIPVAKQHCDVTGPDASGLYTCDLKITADIIAKGNFFAGNTMQLGLAIDPTPTIPNSYGDFTFKKFIYDPTVIVQTTPPATTKPGVIIPTTPATPKAVTGLTVSLK